MLTKQDIVEFLNGISDAETPIRVLWVSTSEARNELAQDLRANRFPLPTVPIVLRKPQFTVPNAILADLIDLLNDHRKDIEEVFAKSDRDLAALTIVLLCKTSLGVAQLGSPVVLPSWFPILANRNIDIVVRDITWDAGAPLSGTALNAPELSEELLLLEDALVARLARVFAQDHNSGNRLLNLLRTVDKHFTTYADALNAATAARLEITIPSGFRPSLKNQTFIVSRLVAVGLSLPPSNSESAAQALADALALPSSFSYYEGVVSLLCRPQPFNPEMPRRFARNLLASTTAAYQLTTAAAHAGDYGLYPAAVLRSLSVDIRRSLLRSREALAILE